jgi:hypothetical protein
MSAFDERRKGFEEKLRLEEELSFRLTARRNHLFGRWAAGALGLCGSAVDDYARSVVLADLQQPGDDDVIVKAEQDLSAKSILTTREQLRQKLDEFAREARAQLMVVQMNGHGAV